MCKKETVKNKSRPRRTARSRRWTFRRVGMVVPAIIIALVLGAYYIPTTRWAQGSGYIMTDKEIELRPPVEGVIASLDVHSGQLVKPGQLVIQLRDDTHRLARDEAKQELAGKQAKLSSLTAAHKLSRQRRKEWVFQAKRRLELATDEYEKMCTSSSGIFSKQEMEKTRLEVDLARSRLAELELDEENMMALELAVLNQDIEAIGKRVDRLEAEVQLRRICTPIGGTVQFNRFEIGEVVKPEHVLGNVFDTGAWVVKLKIRERDMAHVKVGQSVQVALSAYPSLRHGYVWATVSRVLRVVTPQATGDGVFYVEAKLSDPGEMRYQPGMTARAAIDTGRTNWLFKIIGW